MSIRPAPPHVLDLATRWLHAHLNRDAEFIRENSASPDSRKIHTIASFPVELTLDEFLERLQASSARIEVSSDPFGFVAGEVSWVIDLPSVHLPGDVTRRARQTTVLVEEAGTWKVVHSHLSEGVAHDV
jgi:SnoaL-like domain